MPIDGAMITSREHDPATSAKIFVTMVIQRLRINSVWYPREPAR